MQTIRSVGVLSLAKIMGATQACAGLIFVPFFLLFAALSAMAPMQNNPFGTFGAVGMAVMAILVPVFYGVFGFIAGALGALIYNLLARRFGGIEIELQFSPVSNVAQPTV